MSSSRWAGAITRAVEDQYQLGMRSLAAQVAGLGAAVAVLAARCALRPGELGPHSRAMGPVGAGVRGAPAAMAAPRSGSLRPGAWGCCGGRLGAAERALAAGHPSITVGGKRLWRTRNHLEVAELTEQQWRQRWGAARMFLSADGESGKAGGNETIRVDEHARLRIKAPAALTSALGCHVLIAAPVGFSHRGQQWAARVTARAAVRYDISYDPAGGRWYLDASWKTTPEPAAELADLRDGPRLGDQATAGRTPHPTADACGHSIDQARAPTEHHTTVP